MCSAEFEWRFGTCLCLYVGVSIGGLYCKCKITDDTNTAVFKHIRAIHSFRNICSSVFLRVSGFHSMECFHNPWNLLTLSFLGLSILRKINFHLSLLFRTIYFSSSLFSLSIFSSANHFLKLKTKTKQNTRVDKGIWLNTILSIKNSLEVFNILKYFSPILQLHMSFFYKSLITKALQKIQEVINTYAFIFLYYQSLA